MMKKLFALVLAVMMVVALVPAVISSAEEVDFSVPTDGKSAQEIAASYGKDLTTGTRADALVHGVDDCFEVNGTKYKTFADAWAAMRPGYTLKLLGNVHAADWKAMSKDYKSQQVAPFTDNAGVGVYTIDGQGYVLDIKAEIGRHHKPFFLQIAGHHNQHQNTVGYVVADLQPYADLRIFPDPKSQKGHKHGKQYKNPNPTGDQ